VVAGDLTVIPADHLLISIDSQTIEYGSQTNTRQGIAAAGTVSAVYCLNPANCNGSNLYNLNTTRIGSNQWRAADNAGGAVVFDTKISGGNYSNGGYLVVGNYEFDSSSLTRVYASGNAKLNFVNHYTIGGVLTVEPLTINPTLLASNKTYDGNTSVSLRTSIAGLSGDSLGFDHVSASFDNANVGNNKTVTLFGVRLFGSDAANYRLASYSLNTFANILALSTPTSEPATNTSPFIPVINPNPSSGGGFGFNEASPANDGDMAASLDNPFELSTDDPGQCRVDNLEACGCDTTGPEPDLDICYQRFVSMP
jgi:hypothetical protein